MNASHSPGSSTSKHYGFIKNIPFFACLSEEELSGLGKIIIEKHFLKNEIILMEEDTTNYMYIVYSGKVKAVQTAIDGRERILAIHKKGDFFGEMALLDGKTAPATVIAMEDADIGLIGKNDFEKYLLTSAKILREIISVLCTRLREGWLTVKVLSFADAEQRVRSVFAHLSKQYGVEDQRGTIITLRLTHKDIADYASVSGETVTRLLDKFCKAKEIEILDNKHILLKPPFLEKTLFL